MPTLTLQPVNCNGLSRDQVLEQVNESLPYVDLKTALSNRTVIRDPISGLGVSTTSCIENKGRMRTKSLNRKVQNPILMAWEETPNANGNSENKIVKSKVPVRDPIALTGDLGEEVDTLRTTPRPRTGTPREPKRNPISGEGNFGAKEWDPVWKHSGRNRRSKSSNGIRSNPITGANLKSFEISLEEKPGSLRENTGKSVPTRNVITGINCGNYMSVHKSKGPMKNLMNGASRNAITGENCASFEINSEIRTPRQPARVQSSNPLRGENVSTYILSRDEKQRTCKPYVYKNTLTGENLESYQITPIERKVKPKASRERQDPVCGENVKTYTYRVGEGNMAKTNRDISSPITGDGSRGQSYMVSTEERTLSNGRQRARSSGAIRNVLTGENCETYSVYKEMRSERTHIASNGCSDQKNTYNILTGT